MYAKIIKKGNDMFGILREGGDGKNYTMKGVGSFVINHAPYLEFDLSGLPDSNRMEVFGYVNKGKKHHVKRKLKG